MRATSAEFAGKIERLQWEGAKKLVIRRSARESSPGPVAATGTRFKIECEGRTWIGELFEERAPRICKAFLEALPLEGPITNTHGSGDMIHFWARVPNAPIEERTQGSATKGPSSTREGRWASAT